MSKLPSSIYNTIIFNPVMTKELRQAVKGTFAVFGVNILLIALLICTLVVFSNYTDESMRSRNEAIGKEFFGAVLVILAVIIWGIMPLNHYFRTSIEKNPDEPDLMYITKMTPAQIVLGKYFTALFQVLLYLGICLPFLALPYLFEGIDIFTMLRAVVQVAVAAVLFFQVSLLLASLPKRKFLLWILAAVFSGMVFGMIIFMTEEMLPGVFRYYGSKRPDPLWNKYTLIVISLASFFLYILNHAFMKPDTANRALWPRLAFTVLIILSLIVFTCIAVHYMQDDYLAAWFMFALPACIVCLLFSISERDRISSRITKTIPKNPLKWLAFPFYSGSASGILWSVGLTTLCSLAGIAVYIYVLDYYGVNKYSRGTDILKSSIYCGLGTCGYCLAVFFFTRLLKLKDVKIHSWLIASILLAFVCIIPVFLVEEFRKSEAWYVFCPYGPVYFAEARKEGLQLFSQTVLTGIFFIFSVLSLKYTLPQVLRFKFYQAPPIEDILNENNVKTEVVA